MKIDINPEDWKNFTTSNTGKFVRYKMYICPLCLGRGHAVFRDHNYKTEMEINKK